MSDGQTVRNGPQALAMLAVLLVVVGCASQDGPRADRQSTSVAGTAPAGADSTRRGELVVLRRAMIPLDGPQPVRIELREERDTTGEGFPPTRHELHLELNGTLVGEAGGAEGLVPAKLILEHIRLEYTAPGRPGEMLTYDSDRNEAGAGNPLADLMAVVAGAEVALTVGPTGRLTECDGLDPRWRQANLLLAPPSLLTAQCLFRDIGMCELLSEALFPPMPAESVRVGETFEVKLPANIMLAAPLVSHLTGTFAGVDSDERGNAVALIDLVGTVKPGSVAADQPTGIVPVVRSSRHHVTQRICPDMHSLQQDSQRSLEVVLTLQPPNGDQRREMIIRQTRVLLSHRGPEP